MKTARNPDAPSASDPVAVLVIDDSDVDRATIAELLEQGGFTVHCLTSPIGATKAARTLEVQVVILDQNMPVMDGSKLSILFRSSPSMRNIRVVLVSGGDDDVMAELTKQAQADAFVSKRNLHRDLVETVRRLVS